MAGAILVNFKNGKCGNAAYTYCGDILFHGDTFQGKPYEGVSICAWINLKSVEGSHSIFDTIGMTHTCGQYHFEVINGMVRWFHRNESQVTIFSNTAEGLMVKPGLFCFVCLFFFRVSFVIFIHRYRLLSLCCLVFIKSQLEQFRLLGCRVFFFGSPPSPRQCEP